MNHLLKTRFGRVLLNPTGTMRIMMALGSLASLVLASGAGNHWGAGSHWW